MISKPEDAVKERVLAVPGDELGDDELKAGIGTYKMHGKIFASQLGIVNCRAGYINVTPLGGRYIPRPGDSVIGIIKEIGPSSWIVDINSPYSALLHVNEAPWKVDFGDTRKYLDVGDLILAKINNVDETKRVQLTMKEHGLRKLAGGQLIRISHSKVPRMIGKSGSMISMLKQYTNSRMFIGQNGNIWLDGSMENILLATQAIDMIEENTQMMGLTESVKEFLEKNSEPESDEYMGVQ